MKHVLLVCTSLLFVACGSGKGSKKEDPAPSCTAPQVLDGGRCRDIVKVDPKSPEPPTDASCTAKGMVLWNGGGTESCITASQFVCAQKNLVLSDDGKSCESYDPNDEVLSFDKQVCLPKVPSFAAYCMKRLHLSHEQKNLISAINPDYGIDHCKQSAEKLLQKTELDLGQAGPVDLSLLQDATQLKTLRLASRPVSYAALEHLPALEVLKLDGGQTDEDVAVLSKLPNLHDLSLGDAKAMTDKGMATVGTLKGLTNLTMNYPGTRPSLAALAGLTNLEALTIGNLADTSIVAADLSRLTWIKRLYLPATSGAFEFLSALTQLEDLQVNTLGPNFEPKQLATLTQLESFDGTCRDPNCLSQLPQPEKMQSFVLRRRPVSAELDVRDLRALTGLEKLSILDSSQRDLAGIETMTKLKHLEIEEGSLETMAGIEELEAIEIIKLWEVNILQLKELGRKPRLKSFVYRNFEEFDASALRGAPLLESLQIHSKTLADTSFLADLKNLTSFHLFRGLVDPNHLADMTKLESAWIRELQPDLKPLAGLTTLNSLTIVSITGLTLENCPKGAASRAVASYCQKAFP